MAGLHAPGYAKILSSSWSKTGEQAIRMGRFLAQIWRRPVDSPRGFDFLGGIFFYRIVPGKGDFLPAGRCEKGISYPIEDSDEGAR